MASTQLSWTIQQASRSSQGSSPGHPECPIPQYFPYRIESAVNKRKWEAKTQKEKVPQGKHLLSQFCAMQVLVHSCNNLIQQKLISELNDQIFVESELSDSKLILPQCDCFCLIIETHIRIKERKVKPRSERDRRGRWQGRKLLRNASKQNEPSSSLSLSASL